MSFGIRRALSLGVALLHVTNSRKKNKQEEEKEMKKVFEVVNVNSGHSFGHIAVESEKEALDLVSQDAGYESYKEACDVTGTDELVAEKEE